MWHRKSDEPLDKNRMKHKQLDDSRKSIIESKLTIDNVSRADAGEYECQVMLISQLKSDVQTINVSLEIQGMFIWDPRD